ncbi:unnamed protein product [Closterium sp. NIES-64]|nr:unnamed protein product [Closterium sp. NIES-64]
MSTKLQVSKAVTKKNTATGGPVQSPGKVQNGTKKKSTEAAPKPRTSSGDGPPGGEVRKSSRPRKAKVWFEEGADATEEGADPVKYVGNNLDGEDAGDEPEEENLAEDDAEEKADEEEGDEAEEEEGDEAEEEEDDEAEEEEDDEVEEEEDEESEEGQGDEDEAEKGSEKGDSAEVEEGADAHKPQITRKGSFDEMLEEQGDADDEDMEDEAVAEERAMLLGKLKGLDEIKEPVVSSKPARKVTSAIGKDKVLATKSILGGKSKREFTLVVGGAQKKQNTGEVSAKPKSTPTAAGAGTSGGKAKAGAGASWLKAKASAGASGVKAKAGAGTSGVKAKAGAGTSGVKAKAGAGAKPTSKEANTKTKVTFPPSLPSRIQSAATNQYSGAAPPVKVITEATKRYELVPVKKTPFVAASCDRRQEHGGVSNVELDQFERRVMARFAEMLSAILRGAGPSVPIGAPAATPPHSGPSTSSSEGLPSSISPLANHREIVYKAVVDFKELSRRVATHLCFNIEASMIQFYPSAEEALDHGFSEFVSPQVLASLRVLFQHNDASTRGVFFEQLSSTRTSINGWMRKVALTALGRQANRCYLGRLPADLLAPLEFYTDEELIARYKDGERGLAWHRELLIPFGSLIFSVSIKLALARRGVNTEKIKTRQLGWILYAFEWPILNNAPDGKLSGKWEYNRIQYEEMCTRVKREVEIAVIDHGVPYASNTNTFNFPNGVYIDASDMETLVSRVQVTLLNSSHLIRPLPPISSVPFLPISSVPFFPSHPSPSSHLIRPLPPISSVPFFPSHPSPSSHLIRPLPPISSVPFLPSPSVPYASLHRLHDLHQPGLSRSMGTCGAAVAATGQVRSSRGSMGTGVEQQGQQGDRCGAAVAAWGQVRSSSGSMGTGAEQQWQHGDRCGAAGAAWGQVRSSSGSMGTGAEQQGQHGDRCEASGAAGGQVRSSSGSRGTGAEQQWQHGDRCGAAVAAWGQVRSSRGSMGTGAEQQGQQGDRCGAAGAAGGQVRSSRGSRRTGAEQQGQEGDRCGGA